jgi:trigger factor
MEEKMSYTVENLEKSMAKITITVSAEDFEAAMVKSYNKNKKSINLQGFRRGKAPRKMIERMYGPEVFYEDAANFAIPDAYEEAAKECGLDIVSRPDIDVVDIAEGKEFVFTATVAVKPEVTLGDYKGVEVEKREVKIVAADVNAELERVREQNSRMITIEDRGIEKDDTAVIDFEGFVDGETFQGGKGEDYPLVIGSHSFIDTFEDQLVGKKVGEEVDVNVTFPQEYHEESLKGKPALFKVKVKEIKQKELPKLDDEFASEVSEFETLKDYKASIKKTLTERKKEEVKREKEGHVIEKVVENATVELPAPMIDEQVRQMVQEFAGRIQQQGLSFDQYMQMTGMSIDNVMTQMRPEAEKRIKTRLTLEAIAAAEKIQASEKDIEAEIENMASMYQMEVDKVKEMLGDAEKEQIALDLAVQKTVEFLTKQAKEVAPKEEEKTEE